MSENTPQAVPGVVIPEDTRPEESMDSAGRRWWNDPVFHAQASVAVNVATAGQPDDGFDRWHRDSLVAGVTIALHLVSSGVITPEPSGMDWRPPATDPEF